MNWAEWLRRLRAGGSLSEVAETYSIRVFSMALSLAVTILSARFLGPEGRGWLVVALTIVGTIVSFGHLGLHASNTYFLSRDPARLRELVGNSFLVTLVLGGGLAAGVLVVAALWPAAVPIHGLILAVAMAWIPVQIATILAGHLLLGLGMIRSYNLVELFTRLGNFLGVGALALLGMSTPGKFLAVHAAVSIPGLIACVWMLLAKMGGPPRVSIPLLRQCSSYGLKMYAGSMMGYLLLNMDVFLVNRFLGADQNGLYNLAVTIGNVILILPSVVQYVLFPRLVALPGFPERWGLMRRALLSTLLYLVPVCLLVGLAARPLVVTLFGAPFLGGVTALYWLLPGIVLLGVANLSGTVLGASGLPPVGLLPGVVALVWNLGANLYLIPRYGIAGAAIASTTAYLLQVAGTLVLVWHYLRHPQELDGLKGDDAARPELDEPAVEG